jgi:membrane protein DedA with SNARE-associated domain
MGLAGCFLVPAIVCGMLKMKYSQFVVWNFIDGVIYVLAVGPPATPRARLWPVSRAGAVWVCCWPG